MLDNIPCHKPYHELSYFGDQPILLLAHPIEKKCHDVIFDIFVKAHSHQFHQSISVIA